MIKVFISAGHGGKDPGGCANGFKEKDVNLLMATTCANYLKNAGVDVVLSRTCDEDDPVGDEVREANASGADIAISFHENIGKGDGSESWYYSYCNKSKELARYMESASISLGQNSRGCKATTSLYFLTRTHMPAVLVESAFLDNAEDVKIIDTDTKVKALGVAYGVAICKFLNILTPPAIADRVNRDITIKCKTEMNIRDGAGVEYNVVGKLDNKYKYTIVATATAKDGGTWGKLKSGIGWINISDKYVDRF